jgi:predicted DCC family thiol-disulfide oxidoreductase YuxK
MAVTIYYDGECPFCANYVSLLRLRESAGRVALVDLRGDADARSRMQALGHDPDLGMVVETGGASYAGSDALNALALLTTPSGVFNRLNAWAFRSAAASRIVYPLMRAGRNLVLTLLGRQPIAGEDAGVMAKFTIFCAIFGLFSIFHGLNSVFEYRLAPSWHLAAVALLGVANVFRPGRPSLFILLMLVSLLSGWLNAPVGSNHTFLRNVLAAGFFAVYAAHLLRGARWSQVFTDFSAL